MIAPRVVVLHADDFGMSDAVNRGIITGFADGLLTSTAILPNGPAFDDAVRRWSALEQARSAGQLGSAGMRRTVGDDSTSPFDLGVHLNLTQGRPLTTGFPQGCLDGQGRFAGLGALAWTLTVAASRCRSAIVDELEAQITRVMQAGLQPTHVNGHQYIELIPAVARPIRALMTRFGIPALRVAREQRIWDAVRNHPSPLRNVCRTFVASRLAEHLRRNVQGRFELADAYCGSAHAGRMSLDMVRRWVHDLPPGRTLEIGLHPGCAAPRLSVRDTDDGWSDALGDRRPLELAWLQSEALGEVLHAAHVRLGRIRALGRRTRSAA